MILYIANQGIVHVAGSEVLLKIANLSLLQTLQVMICRTIHEDH
jgi:hypothetical protein